MGPISFRRALSATIAATIAATFVGEVLGAAVAWLTRRDLPSCTTADNGMRACMSIYVIDPPLWLYGASRSSAAS
jgi:hypothetical protein